MPELTDIYKQVLIDSLSDTTGINFKEYKEYVYEFTETYGKIKHTSVGFKMKLTDQDQMDKFRNLISEYRPVEILAGGYDEKAIMLGFVNQNPGHFNEPNCSFAIYSKTVVTN